MSASVYLWTLMFFCDRIGSQELKYLWGDAIEDPLALSLDGTPYPWDLSAKVAGRQLRHSRTFGETPQLLTPEETRKIILRAFQFQEVTPNVMMMNEKSSSRGQGHRRGRVEGSERIENSSNNITLKATGSKHEYEGCVPSRLCQSTYNTTAPLFGVSLTSGKPVTIVQKFPDLLQQVVFQVCKSNECDVVHGECVQTFIPYLFLVLPLGPVSITGQDYILVESGCTCQPRYAKKYLTPPLPFIQPIN